MPGTSGTGKRTAPTTMLTYPSLPIAGLDCFACLKRSLGTRDTCGRIQESRRLQPVRRRLAGHIVRLRRRMRIAQALRDCDSVRTCDSDSEVHSSGSYTTVTLWHTVLTVAFSDSGLSQEQRL